MAWFWLYINRNPKLNVLHMRKTKNDSVTLSGGKTHAHLDYTALRKAVLVLRAVNHKLRQRIIDLLEEGNNMTVTDIYIKLRLEQSVASQHLAILRRSGVVVTDRQGKFIYYSLDKDRIAQISRLVEELAN
ncbi:MAG TPA: metalloregulator ArsR/SmtB family transcription factor [Saprospiraceae bacterium]|nr:metalloregulator ArsR/SmtB family transcription factor [Saprospiraceae bacterium]HQW55919.1 metalloregulator ArsR/SmtB family transcription factor [Saprospiraceae bacterium]